jgi:hypothetical protein
MQKFTILRRVAPLMAILALAVVMASSCNSTSKYGCPNKLEASSSLR